MALVSHLTLAKSLSVSNYYGSSELHEEAVPAALTLAVFEIFNKVNHTVEHNILALTMILEVTFPLLHSGIRRRL